MAEYKGLTIRIGGDTSQLNTALKASTKAASSLQSQLKQITRAMRFDPGNIGNVDTRMKLTTNRAEALYSKIAMLKSGYQELGAATVSVGGSSTSVKKLAESTENVALAATTAKERYNEMTATLASRYRELEARAKQAGEAMNLNALSRQGSGETFETQMAALRELGVITDEEIEKLREMRATWNEAFDSSEAYRMASQLEGMSVDMQRLESEARSAVSTVRELNTVSSYSADNWQESAQRVRAMDSALSECAKQAKAYEAALREDPSNLSAAIGRLKALSNEYTLAVEKSDELSQQVEAYKSRLSGVLAEQKNLPRYIQETGDQWQKVHNELNEAKGEANALRQSMQRLSDKNAPMGDMLALSLQIDKADAKVDELTQSARRMDEAFETAKECAELQRLQAELTETDAHAYSLKKRMELTSLGEKSVLNASTVKSAGMTLYSTLTPAITMLGWRAVSAAKDIDSAYRNMRKTVDGTEQQFEALRQGAIEFSKTHVTSAAQLLEIESIGGELGVQVDNLDKFAETVSNIEVATNYSTEDAATMLGQLANITHMTADEYEGFSDALVRLGNNGASTETQIGDIATRVGSMGAIVGMTTPDILAWSSTLASTGQQAEAAGTAFSKTMSLMETSVAAAGGTMDTSFDAINNAVMEGTDRLTIFSNFMGMTADEFSEAWSMDPTATFEGLQEGLTGAQNSLQMIADVAHMSAGEFAQAWESDPTVALKRFIEGLNDIEDSGGSADSVLGSLGITATRQKQAIEGLMQTIGLLDDNLTMSKDAWNGTSDQWGAAGDAAREAQKKAEGFSGQIEILSNVANDTMASLADGAVPVISVLTDLATSMLGLFDGMEEDGKTAVVVALGLGAAAGPILTIASTFVTAKQNIKAFVTESNAMGKAIRILKAGFTDAGGGADGMKLKLMSLGEAAKTVGKSLVSGLATAAVVAGIAVAIAAISNYVKKMQETREAAQNAGDVIGSALNDAAARQGNAIGGLTSSYDELVSKIAEHNRTIRDSARETYRNADMISEYGEALKSALAAYNDDRTPRNLANLKTQLDLYNGAAGTSINLTQDESGSLQLMKDNAVLSADAFDKLTQSMMNAAKAEFFKSAYTAKMGDYHDALAAVETAQKGVESAAAALDEAMNDSSVSDGEITELTIALTDAQTEYENTKRTLASTKTAMDQYGEGMKLIAEAQLENASAAVQWVAGNDELQASIWANGGSVTEFAHSLEGLGIGYDSLTGHADGIRQMASTWDGSIGTMIAGLQAMGVEIDLSKVKIEGLNAIQIEGKTYYVDDMGTIFDQEGRIAGLGYQLSTIDGASYEVTDSGSADSSKGDVEELTSAIGAIPKATSVDVSAYVTGMDSINSLYNTLETMTSRTWSTTVVASGVRSATGSVASTPYIARHAAGYIAKGPTLTNNGWVGEAGAEAVLNWGTGGAVIPLTNERYMRPIADAIGSQMKDLYGSSTSNVTNIYIDGVQALPDSRIYDVSYELATTILDQRRA